MTGWTRVAELRVHTGGVDDSSATVGTVPSREATPELPKKHRVRSWSDPSVYAGIVFSFGFTFALTSLVVLGFWFGVVGILRAQLRPETTVVAQLTPPVAPPTNPGLTEAQLEERIAAALERLPIAQPPPVEIRTVQAPPIERRVIVYEPAPIERTTASATGITAPPVADLPYIEPPPERLVEPVLATPPPPPEPVVPSAARALDGTYVGKASGKPVSFDIRFHAGDKASATVRTFIGRDTETEVATGSYRLLGDGSATVALMDENGSVYSGTISGGSVTGQVTVDGRSRGKFDASR